MTDKIEKYKALANFMKIDGLMMFISGEGALHTQAAEAILDLISMIETKVCSETMPNPEPDDKDRMIEIYNQYNELGLSLFQSSGMPLLCITADLATINISLSTEEENGFAMYQGDYGETQGITLKPSIDRDDAVRIAGLLMAWAGLDSLHGGKK